MSTSSVPALPAATVLLVQDSADGVTVLMVKRQSRGFFGGLMVFPGGAVEDQDTSAIAGQVVPGRYEDFEYRVAALRELAEETGLVLTATGTISSPDERGEALFRAMRSEKVQFEAGRLVLVSRWVTPEYVPRRFDTWFYLAEAVSPPQVRLDRTELVDHTWVSAEEALHHHEAGEWKMFLPTLSHLRWLSRLSTVSDAMVSAAGADGRTRIRPKMMDDGSIVPIQLPA